MKPIIRENYDQVPYPATSHFYTHPDRLATPATLLGLDPPPVEQCLVLELGCAGGGNLIPMAYGLPESRFVGIDLSAGQIEAGQAVVQTLGLRNISLRQMDILEISPDLGQFDYIIAHGVYSWVSPQVRDKLLNVCRQNLAPNGIAYVSFNTYPGWHMLGSMREMMQYHTQHQANPEEQAKDARWLVDFLANSIPDDLSPHSGFLKSYTDFYKKRIFPRDDSFLLHDELAEFNDPVYFYQFAEQIAEFGLQYVSDAHFQTTLAGNLPPHVARTLQKIVKDNIALEQYLDFLYNRTFRQSLLCHAGATLNVQVTPARLEKFFISSMTQPANPDLQLDQPRPEQFRASDGNTLTTDHPLAQAAMLHLAEVWPQAISLKALLAAARNRLNGAAPGKESAREIEILGATLLKGYSSSKTLVQFHRYAPSIKTKVGPQPVASPVARLQVKDGPKVTNLRHERVSLAGATYHLLPYLDGDHTHAALLDILQKKMENNELQLKEQDRAKSLAEVLGIELQRLARAALLVG